MVLDLQKAKFWFLCHRNSPIWFLDEPGLLKLNGNLVVLDELAVLIQILENIFGLRRYQFLVTQELDISSWLNLFLALLLWITQWVLNEYETINFETEVN